MIPEQLRPALCATPSAPRARLPAPGSPLPAPRAPRQAPRTKRSAPRAQPPAARDLALIFAATMIASLPTAPALEFVGGRPAGTMRPGDGIVIGNDQTAYPLITPRHILTGHEEARPASVTDPGTGTTVKVVSRSMMSTNWPENPNSLIRNTEVYLAELERDLTGIRPVPVLDYSPDPRRYGGLKLRLFGKKQASYGIQIVQIGDRITLRDERSNDQPPRQVAVETVTGKSLFGLPNDRFLIVDMRPLRNVPGAGFVAAHGSGAAVLVDFRDGRLACLGPALGILDLENPRSDQPGLHTDAAIHSLAGFYRKKIDAHLAARTKALANGRTYQAAWLSLGSPISPSR